MFKPLAQMRPPREGLEDEKQAKGEAKMKAKEGAQGKSNMSGLAVSDEPDGPDKSDKKELPEMGRHPGLGRVLEAKFPEEGVVNLIKFRQRAKVCWILQLGHKCVALAKVTKTPEDTVVTLVALMAYQCVCTLKTPSAVRWRVGRIAFLPVC